LIPQNFFKTAKPSAEKDRGMKSIGKVLIRQLKDIPGKKFTENARILNGVL
jgi:hypothetical protein